VTFINDGRLSQSWISLGGLPVVEPNLFKWRRYESEIILLCVRWYLRYALSYRDLEEMMKERNLTVDHTMIYRWVQKYAPEIEKRCRPHLQPTNDSYRVDETYVKIKGKRYYLYRGVDRTLLCPYSFFATQPGVVYDAKKLLADKEWTEMVDLMTAAGRASLIRFKPPYIHPRHRSSRAYPVQNPIWIAFRYVRSLKSSITPTREETMKRTAKRSFLLGLVVPEMDTNVDPASTWQVVNALIKANRRFDLLFIPGGGHGAGGAYYQRLLQDFFVHHLHGVEPPDWNKVEQNKTPAATGNWTLPVASPSAPTLRRCEKRVQPPGVW
jgi:DDE domain/Prolyl oligopeptidase family